jgi:hypothetical protein
MPCGDGVFTNHCADPNAAPSANLRRRVDEITIDHNASVERFRPAHVAR